MSGMGRWTAILTLAVLATVAIPAVAPVADAAPTAAAGGGGSSPWAYGAQHWWNSTGNFTGGTYSARAFFGWTVVVSETNTSATTREVQGVRTVGMSYFLNYCRPNCTAPLATANVSLVAWQQRSAFVNLTTTATVYAHTGGSFGPSTAVTALGIDNASMQGRGHLSDSYAIREGTRTSAQGSLAVSTSSSMGVDFAPALGILPWNVSAGESWNATSAFTAHGGWNDSFTHMDTLRGVSSSASGNSSGAVNRSGTERVYGRDLGNVTLSNGANVTVLVIGYLGPFGFGDGLFLTEGAADLFAGPTSAWSGFAFAQGEATPSAIDVAIAPNAHVATVSAASVSVGVGSTTVGAANVGTAGGATIGGPSPVGPGNANQTVQGEPESPQSANAQSVCLTGGCSTGASGSSGFGHALAIALVAAVAVAAIALVAAYMLRGPRRPAVAPGGSAGSP